MNESTRRFRLFHPKTVPFLILALLALLLAGCQSGPVIAPSAEQAAVNAITSQGVGRNAVIDPQSVRVLQSQAMNDSTFVLVRFEQTSEGRQEKCLFTYETARNQLGLWSPRTGGGGCSGAVTVTGGEPPPDPPLEMGGGTSGGSGRGDPGYSYTNGLVYQADIEQVRVTWDDGQQQVVPVINGSYLALRAGQSHSQSVEGLNAAGEVVHSSSLEVPPGKSK